MAAPSARLQLRTPRPFGGDIPAFRANTTLHVILAATALGIAISAYHPAMVVDWILENLLVVVLFVYLAATYPRYPLSNVSYGLIFVFTMIHEWGAHHKYADVPLGEWMKVWLHTTRNHYDRVVHFAFGLMLAYPMQETYYRYANLRGFWAYFFPVETSMAFGAVYECIEATVASIVSPEAGDAYVGMQGDFWDSQKDMANGMAGAIIAMGILWMVRIRSGASVVRTVELSDNQ